MTREERAATRLELWEAQGHLCPWCAKPIEHPESAVLDHRIPKSHSYCGGATHQKHNLQLLHPECDDAKAGDCPVCKNAATHIAATFPPDRATVSVVQGCAVLTYSDGTRVVFAPRMYPPGTPTGWERRKILNEPRTDPGPPLPSPQP